MIPPMLSDTELAALPTTTDREIRTFRYEHRRKVSYNTCAECGRAWPCPVIRLTASVVRFKPVDEDARLEAEEKRDRQAYIEGAA